MPAKLTRPIFFIIALPSVFLFYFLKNPAVHSGKKTIAILPDNTRPAATIDTEANRFTKTVLIEKMDEPLQLAVLDANRVLYIERKGKLWLYDNAAKKKKLITTIPVSTKYTDKAGKKSEAEDGLLGIATDPDFITNKWIYLYYSPAGTQSKNVLARFEFSNNKLITASKKIILEVPVQREQCCHTGGGIAFDSDNNLYLSTGDNTSPRATAYAPIDERKERSPWDAQKSSANTNDLRGKVIRIHPLADGKYSIPAGNLFPAGTTGTRPEIYVMGTRNPYRISVDKKTGYLYWGDVGPDSGTDSLGYGPRSYDEINQAKTPGYYGWPYFVGNNQAYWKYDFTSNTSGDKFDPQKNSFTHFRHNPKDNSSLSNDTVTAILEDHAGNLWIGSYFGGLDCYKNGQFIHYRHDEKNPNSLADDRVWEIFEDSKQQLWAGLLGGGLDKFDKQKNIFYHHSPTLPNSIHSNYVAAIIEDKDRQLWIGTDNGIDVLNNSTNTITHYDNYTNANSGLSNNNIITLLEDSRGLIWIGTRDGLNVFNKKNNRFTAFRTEDGLPGNTILNILEDNKNTLWISTANGISNISVVAHTNDTTIRISCINYDELDGLQGTEFNENAALKTSKGEIVFGGARGFNIFHPEQIAIDKSPQHLVLTGLQIFNRSVNTGDSINGRILLPQSISITSSIELKYNENILAIEFAALNFSTPQKIKYGYMLEGFSNEWVYTDGKMRKAIYTNLDPGEYTFHVKATKENGEWSDQELVFNINILPPFWKTPLAFVNRSTSDRLPPTKSSQTRMSPPITVFGRL